jgi:hypothetical protein
MITPLSIQNICDSSLPRKTNIGGLNYSMLYNQAFCAARAKYTMNISTSMENAKSEPGIKTYLPYPILSRLIM